MTEKKIKIICVSTFIGTIMAVLLLAVKIS